MRGLNETQTSMLCLNSLESMIPADHPLRPVKALADEALARMSPLFDEMYSHTSDVAPCRPSACSRARC